MIKRGTIKRIGAVNPKEELGRYAALMPPPALAVERFIAEHGTEFKFAPLPKGIKPMREKMCFMNATKLVDRFPERFRYVEGFGFRAYLGGIPFYHAWCIDKDDNVVDPTWRELDSASRYIGVVIPRETLRRELVRLGNYGVLNIPYGGPNFDLIQKLGGGNFPPKLLSKSRRTSTGEATP